MDQQHETNGESKSANVLQRLILTSSEKSQRLMFAYLGQQGLIGICRNKFSPISPNLLIQGMAGYAATALEFEKMLHAFLKTCDQEESKIEKLQHMAGDILFVFMDLMFSAAYIEAFLSILSGEKMHPALENEQSSIVPMVEGFVRMRDRVAKASESLLSGRQYFHNRGHIEPLWSVISTAEKVPVSVKDFFEKWCGPSEPRRRIIIDGKN